MVLFSWVGLACRWVSVTVRHHHGSTFVGSWGHRWRRWFAGSVLVGGGGAGVGEAVVDGDDGGLGAGQIGDHAVGVVGGDAGAGRSALLAERMLVLRRSSVSVAASGGVGGAHA